jgi:putative chitinase
MYKIDNTIPDELESNTKRLLTFLQNLREKWGSGINITSGYRGPKLNKAVKGSKTSAHLTCNAADLYPSNGRFEEFKEFIFNYLSDKNFDQCIIETANKGKVKWIHLGLYNNSGKQRRQMFKIEQ